jgi:hypothetical protein
VSFNFNNFPRWRTRNAFADLDTVFWGEVEDSATLLPRSARLAVVFFLGEAGLAGARREVTFADPLPADARMVDAALAAGFFAGALTNFALGGFLAAGMAADFEAVDFLLAAFLGDLGLPAMEFFKMGLNGFCEKRRVFIRDQARLQAEKHYFFGTGGSSGQGRSGRRLS